MCHRIAGHPSARPSLPAQTDCVVHDIHLQAVMAMMASARQCMGRRMASHMTCRAGRRRERRPMAAPVLIVVATVGRHCRASCQLSGGMPLLWLPWRHARLDTHRLCLVSCTSKFQFFTLNMMPTWCLICTADHRRPQCQPASLPEFLQEVLVTSMTTGLAPPSTHGVCHLAATT